MKLLFIGDIFGHAGRGIVADHLADIRAAQAIDVVIANVENSAAGFGITPAVADELFRYGIDVMTSGNHIWDKRDIYDYFNAHPASVAARELSAGLPRRGSLHPRDQIRRALRGDESAGPRLYAQHRLPFSQSG